MSKPPTHGGAKVGEGMASIAEVIEVMKVQARITLPLAVRREIDRLRTEWNPERAIGEAPLEGVL
ncbi:hypothetical protein [Tuwongella immobilis]|uniref:Uncharacterized protein n=1 Tax=Tuwongella immobilis TaxID=692036 RepID=A0A6C2YTE8_9BACT|nr:hypothetical protein [Tuwongella immobilis]VIP04746.1 unnamed protein product [Tuwongella immobilis]VTS06851.1 unnamed protein product [Tuwongella immobilis]